MSGDRNRSSSRISAVLKVCRMCKSTKHISSFTQSVSNYCNSVCNACSEIMNTRKSKMSLTQTSKFLGLSLRCVERLVNDSTVDSDTCLSTGDSTELPVCDPDFVVPYSKWIPVKEFANTRNYINTVYRAKAISVGTYC